ncbi:homocitrate synthase 2 [Spirochaeta thermophila]|uniref:Homocitrate synthase 2 n=1 Tax=Winmispira thermophila (strain ATCC 49972 / DSM 6192 / RI 19.B1) TaxID=665571 RepID=E0RPC0_WINT6|nr:homocitrate synthase 2 [Spirochaeta thermophila]ADN01314.1 homocitrate synthase 2 [Spirochaeta thermophila DSM 6192]
MRIGIVDTTLRDGEQAAGFAFSSEEKFLLARRLLDAGVDEVEVGFAAVGRAEKVAIRRIVDGLPPQRVLGWNRALPRDVLESLSLGLVRLHVSVPVSDILIRIRFGGDRGRVRSLLREAVLCAREKGGMVSVGAEDASRADLSFLVEIACVAEEVGAFRFRYADTTGTAAPWETYERISFLARHVKIPVELHMHNDLGLAVANTLSGIRAGASWVDTSICGMGERAGLCPLEEVVVAIRVLTEGETSVDPSRLPGLASLLERITGVRMPPWKSVVGENAFSHESGLHQKGVMRDPGTYEPFSPSLVGRVRRVLAGKHASREAFGEILASQGVRLPPPVEDLLFRIMKGEVGLEG